MATVNLCPNCHDATLALKVPFMVSQMLSGNVNTYFTAHSYRKRKEEITESKQNGILNVDH